MCSLFIPSLCVAVCIHPCIISISFPIMLAAVCLSTVCVYVCFANIFSRDPSPMIPMDFHTNGPLSVPPELKASARVGVADAKGPNQVGQCDTHTHTHCNVLGIYCCGFVEAIYWQYLSPAWPGAFSTISTGTVPLEDYQHSSSFSPGKRPLVKFMRGFISSVHNNFILILICSDILGSTDGCFPTRNEFIWVLWPAVKPASNKQNRSLEQMRLHVREQRSQHVILICVWICWCEYSKVY